MEHGNQVIPEPTQYMPQDGWGGRIKWGPPRPVKCKKCGITHWMRTSKWHSGKTFVPSMCNQCSLKWDIAGCDHGQTRAEMIRTLAICDEEEGGASPWFPPDWNGVLTRHRKWMEKQKICDDEDKPKPLPQTRPFIQWRDFIEP